MISLVPLILIYLRELIMGIFKNLSTKYSFQFRSRIKNEFFFIFLTGSIFRRLFKKAMLAGFPLRRAQWWVSRAGLGTDHGFLRAPCRVR